LRLPDRASNHRPGFGASQHWDRVQNAKLLCKRIGRSGKDALADATIILAHDAF
jgi:hypothetical protein